MERMAVNDRCAAAPEGVVDARAGVAVGFRFFVASEHLNATGHGWLRRAAGALFSGCDHGGSQ